MAFWNNCTDNAVYPTSCYSPIGAVFTVLPILLIILLIVVGNGLVILAVILDKKLKQMRQNWLIVSLAFADFFVGLLIMPLTLTYEILGEWTLGHILCKLWLALDVLFVTASILNLCAISLDRYWSVTDPLRYPRKRSIFRMSFMIATAWFVALAISLPPLLGWRAPDALRQCHLSTELGYVLYSAFGSFMIPVVVVTAVYVKIFLVVKGRIRQKMKEVERKEATLNALNAAHSSSACQTCSPSVIEATSVIISDDEPTCHQFMEKCKPMQKQIFNFDQVGNSNAIQSAPNSQRIEKKCLIRTVSEKPFSKNKNHFANRARASSPPALTDIHELNEKSFDSKCHNQSPMFRQSMRRILKLQKTNRPSQLQVTIDYSTTESPTRTTLSSHYNLKRKTHRKKDRQATMVLGLVLGAFLACWLPFFTLYVLGAFKFEAPELVFDICFWIGYCNSAFNPVIYTLANSEFRAAFIRLLF